MTNAPMPGALRSAIEALGEERRTAFLAHLEGGTSSEYLADWLSRAGHPCSSTTIKRYRRGEA